jgi:hypothetical protein
MYTVKVKYLSVTSLLSPLTENFKTFTGTCAYYIVNLLTAKA